ncbi:MAG: DUF1415 domain-containing protein [Rhodoferax sp.]|nr:DUF1415 domain-containing protein [Rhodoferax sp.]
MTWAADDADALVKHDTRKWLQRAVIGLNLCPFAKSVEVKGQVHYGVSHAVGFRDLLHDLKTELHDLQAVDPAQRDTTLLILPNGFADFLEFNALLREADRMLGKWGYDGVFQIASLHPGYQFAGTEADDITNYTNRSPYPTLHLLREASIDRAVKAFPHAEAIYETNMHTMRQLGLQGWEKLGVCANFKSTNSL